MSLLDQRQECRNSSRLQTRGHELFVSGARLDCVPMRVWTNDCRRSVGLHGCIAEPIHSSALSLTNLRSNCGLRMGTVGDLAESCKNHNLSITNDWFHP